MNRLEAIKRRRAMEQSVAPQPPGIFLEYIQNTGTQWIDTLKPIKNVEYDIKIDLNVGVRKEGRVTNIAGSKITVDTQFRLSFNWGASTGQGIFLWKGNGYVAGNTIIEIPQYTISDKRTILETRGLEWYIDGEYKNTQTNVDTTEQTNNFCIFCNTLGHPTDTSDIKLYSYELKHNSKVIQQLLPFLHQDGRIGMWDTIEGKFYPNMGTGEFIAGPIIDEDFWELEYVESTGTQWIDTGIINSDKPSFIIDIHPLFPKKHRYLTGFGATYDWFECMDDGWRPTNNPTVVYDVNQRHVVELGVTEDLRTYVKLNNEIIKGSSITLPRTFHLGNIDDWRDTIVGNYYGVEVYVDNKLVQKLIPVQKKISGEVCMYDLVSKKFFSNAGTDEFIAGPRKGNGFKLTGTLADDTTFNEILQTETEVKAWIVERKTTLKTIKIDDSTVRDEFKFRNLDSLLDGCQQLAKVEFACDFSEVTTAEGFLKQVGQSTTSIPEIFVPAMPKCKTIHKALNYAKSDNVIFDDVSAVTNCSFIAYGASIKNLTFNTDTNILISSNNQNFNGAKLLENFDIRRMNYSNLRDLNYFLAVCSKIKVVDFSKWKLHKDVNLTTLTFYKTNPDAEAWAHDPEDCDILNAVASKPESWNFRVKDAEGKYLVDGYYTDDTYYFEKFTTETEVKDFITERYATLKTIRINDSNVSNEFKFRDCSSLFSRCTSLIDVNLEDFDVSNVTNMYGTFANCSSLTSLNLANWDTSNVTTLQATFSGCRALTSIDVSNWDTSNVTEMYFTFGDCINLNTIDLSSWDTDNVVVIANIFLNCTSLTTIDLSGMTIHSGIAIDGAFSGTTSVTTAYGKDEESCNLLNASSGKPDNVNFIVKQ